jgi:DNA-binding MarR family transcriptional regulator
MDIDVRALRAQAARMRQGWSRWAAQLLRTAPTGQMTLRQVALLSALDGEQSAGELGDLLGWSASEVARDGRELARQGFVVCEGTPGDPASVRIRASERGAELGDGLLRLRVQALADLAAVMPDDEQRVVARALELLADAAERLGRRVPEAV